MDVISARKTAEGTVNALQDCRSDKSFDTERKMAKLTSNKIKHVTTGTKCSFREATLPIIRKPSTRIQVLVAEPSEGHTRHTTAINHHRVNTYFVALDTGEIKER
jgi:hypothetical protein